MVQALQPVTVVDYPCGVAQMEPQNHPAANILLLAVFDVSAEAILGGPLPSGHSGFFFWIGRETTMQDRLCTQNSIDRPRRLMPTDCFLQ